MRRSRLWLIPFGIVLLLLAVDTVGWWVAVTRLRAGYGRVVAQAAAQGWVLPAVAHDAGWPVAAQLRLDGPVVRQATGGVTWSAGDVELGVSLLHPGVLAISAYGDQVLVLPGGGTWHYRADRFVATAPLGAPVRQARLDATRLVLSVPAGTAVAERVGLAVHWGAGAAEVQLEAGPVRLPALHRWALGQVVRTVRLAAVAHGTWTGGGEAAARAWRDGGGTVDLPSLVLRWGTLDISGSGTAALDGALQPLARLDLRIVDPQAAIAALADGGAISHGQATAANAVAMLLTLPARLAGKPAVVDLPWRLESGALSVGQIPLARVPAVRWGG